MFHTKTTKDNALHRMKIIRGHLDKVLQMIEDNEYCIDILIQTKALRSSLEKVDAVLLEEHLTHCVVDHIKAGQSQKAVDEILKVFSKTK